MSEKREDFRGFAEETYDHVFRATYLAIGERDIAAEGTHLDANHFRCAVV